MKGAVEQSSCPCDGVSLQAGVLAVFGTKVVGDQLVGCDTVVAKVGSDRPLKIALVTVEPCS